MVLGKRTREHSSDSNSGCFEILLNDKPISSSPLRRMQEGDVSGMEAVLRRRKQPKTTPSPSNTKMAWTKDDELIILGSIVDYEKETKLSYKSDWEAFYGYVKDFIEADFSRKQLIDKIRNLNKRFLGNKARCDDGEGPSFSSTEDDEVFKLSMIIWDTTNETEFDSNENMDQAKDAPSVEHQRVDETVDQAKVDAPCVEHEPVNENMDQAKDVPCVDHEHVDEKIDEAEVDAPNVEDERVDVDENMEQAKDAPCMEHERANENMDLGLEKDVHCEEYGRVEENMDQEEAMPCSEDEQVINDSMETDNGEKEKNVEDGVDELCAMKDALTDKEEKEKNKDDSVGDFCVLTDKEDKENNEEDGVEELCAMKDALTDKENNEEDSVEELCAMKDTQTDKEEKEKSEEEEKEKSEDEYCALKDALEEATTLFQSIGKHQQKLMLKKLINLGAHRKKELVDEWKELLEEGMKLHAKKLSLSAELASIADSC